MYKSKGDWFPDVCWDLSERINSLFPTEKKYVNENSTSPVLPSVFLPFRMRRFAYCKVVLATSLVWVMLDMFILLYFSECNKCDNIKERGLPGREGEQEPDLGTRDLSFFLLCVCICDRRPHEATRWTG